MITRGRRCDTARAVASAVATGSNLKGASKPIVRGGTIAVTRTAAQGCADRHAPQDVSLISFVKSFNTEHFLSEYYLQPNTSD
ncbi:MAG: hypothetical protein HKM24_05070 [Gammaproteobacteria bacterium]|nr:hypothetical protein [Gammaproteobacteria bacterium]